ncbi:ribonuclease VapC [Betaproteobacteria bacterium]|nr:ribonuclease VapC [Betaproteobacteria bacterium]GHU33335.1 ribonuclease VapC [Betaproteobacteria bacterium]
MLVLDSNIISYYFRGHSPVVRRLQAVPPASVGIPAIVEYELRYGLLRLPPEAATLRLAVLEKLLAPMQILPFDAACAQKAARIRCALEAQGMSIGPHDVLIAATALCHQAPLVTHNVREFSRVEDLQVLDWYED